MGRRFAVFVLLGPFLVWLIALTTQVPLLIRRPSLEPLPFFGMVLGILIVIGFVPSFTLACADQVMAAKRLQPLSRAAVCAVLAYPVTMLGAWMTLGPGGLREVLGDNIWIAGLFGVIPAACVRGWREGNATRRSPDVAAFSVVVPAKAGTSTHRR